ncbi:hypothetical protein H920_17203 [Fukomys damarensis]|uniref:Uncharacterized protein n=1 Tax=Fukomys damarensis TaxID=885580 RepID=A0A091CQI1_FUKDA|nr:hypothetical protein H920_17203 [Fukomys damarensis]
MGHRSTTSAMAGHMTCRKPASDQLSTRPGSDQVDKQQAAQRLHCAEWAQSRSAVSSQNGKNKVWLLRGLEEKIIIITLLAVEGLKSKGERYEAQSTPPTAAATPVRKSALRISTVSGAVKVQTFLPARPRTTSRDQAPCTVHLTTSRPSVKGYGTLSFRTLDSSRSSSPLWRSEPLGGLCERKTAE